MEALLANLESEHREKERRHRVVQELTTSWLQDDSLTDGDRDTLRKELHELQRIYQGHISREETEVLPIAASILELADFRALPREMKERRRNLAVDWEGQPGKPVDGPVTRNQLQ